MPSLVDPSPKLRASVLEAIAEHDHDADYPIPWWVTNVDPEARTDPAAFRTYVTRLLAERAEGTPRPAGFVPMTTMWWVEGPVMLGRLAIRHRLTPVLERDGGHIGYDVRPSARRRGNATAMLGAALPIARSLGIAEALLTCHVSNVASRKVIESHGGRFVDVVGVKRRYWVATI